MIPNRHIIFFRSKVFIIVLLCLSLVVNVYQWYRLGSAQLKQSSAHSNDAQKTQANDDSTIQEIENYLDAISYSFTADVQTLAKQYGIPSWGCGPSSYALAKIIDKKFFDDQLSIQATYAGNPYEIIERFSFAKTTNSEAVDHAWLEIYLHDKMLFIDPTIGQFGKINGIAYQEFKVDDTTISRTLNKNYDIIDDRLLLLVQKAINRVPQNQEPYPGIQISPSELDYYLKVKEARDTVNQGGLPQDWEEWVDKLLAKYS